MGINLKLTTADGYIEDIYLLALKVGTQKDYISRSLYHNNIGLHSSLVTLTNRKQTEERVLSVLRNTNTVLKCESILNTA